MTEKEMAHQIHWDNASKSPQPVLDITFLKGGMRNISYHTKKMVHTINVEEKMKVNMFLFLRKLKDCYDKRSVPTGKFLQAKPASVFRRKRT